MSSLGQLQKKSVRHLRTKAPLLNPALGGVLLSGLLIRLYGISYGLPYVYDSDESVFVWMALRILHTLDPDPNWFMHPGTTTVYLLVVLYAVVYLVGVVLGYFSTPSDFKALIETDPTILYLGGRLLFVGVGVALVLMIYLITQRVFDKTTGLIAATLGSFVPLLVFYSQKIRTDILMTFLVLVAFWFCLAILAERKWSSYALGGFVTGVAIVTKYPAAVMVLVIVIAHLLAARSQQARFLKLSVSGFACLLGAFLASPFLFLRFETTLEQVVLQATKPGGEAWKITVSEGAGFFSDLTWYAYHGLWESVGPAGLILAAVGMLLCLRSMQGDRWLLVTFPLLFLLFISTLNQRYSHWMIPTLPFLCIFGAHTLYRASNWVGRQSLAGLGASVCFVATIGSVIPLVRASVVQGRELSNKDTRTLAREWILDNIPAGSRMLVEKYTPHLPKERYVFLEAKDGYPTEVDTDRIGESVFAPSWSQIATLTDPKSVMEKDVQYLVLSDWYDRYLAEEDEEVHAPKAVATYEALMSMATKKYEVRRVPGEHLGPAIRVYEFGAPR